MVPERERPVEPPLPLTLVTVPLLLDPMNPKLAGGAFDEMIGSCDVPLITMFVPAWSALMMFAPKTLPTPAFTSAPPVVTPLFARNGPLIDAEPPTTSAPPTFSEPLTRAPLPTVSPLRIATSVLMPSVLCADENKPPTACAKGWLDVVLATPTTGADDGKPDTDACAIPGTEDDATGADPGSAADPDPPKRNVTASRMRSNAAKKAFENMLMMAPVTLDWIEAASALVLAADVKTPRETIAS